MITTQRLRLVLPAKTAYIQYVCIIVKLNYRIANEDHPFLTFDAFASLQVIVKWPLNDDNSIQVIPLFFIQLWSTPSE